MSKIREYNLTPLTLNKRDDPLSRCDPNHLFTLIETDVPASIRVQFCHDLLKAFGQHPRYLVPSFGPLEYWWNSLYDASDWFRFRDFSKNFDMWVPNHNISKSTLETILGHAAVLVGKRILDVYGERIESYAHIGPLDSVMADYKRRMNFIAIDLLEEYDVWLVDDKLRDRLCRIRDGNGTW